MQNTIALLGSTGSIGTQTLDVVRSAPGIRVLALSANKNIELLEAQIREFKPLVAAVTDEYAAKILKTRVADTDTRVYSGENALIAAACETDAECVLTAVVGSAGIKPTYEAICAGKNIALANKETLVSAGELIIGAARQKQIELLPVDSEHSAIFQCLNGRAGNRIKRILLTCSGGAFYGKTREQLEYVTAADALRHPTWSMGKKVTIDSASLMNKGLEVIEACWLFGVQPSQIEVLIHRQSVVHSAVEYEDNSVIAQLGCADMRLPIQYALNYPERAPAVAAPLDFSSMELTFSHPDTDTFCALALAYRAINSGKTLPTVMNAANEIAVERFLSGKLPFLAIAELVGAVMDSHSAYEAHTVEDYLAADEWARARAAQLAREYGGKNV